jgi:hypothetical protein
MYKNLKEKNNFKVDSDSSYWSSSENGNNTAWYFALYSGIASSYGLKGNTKQVRAVRAF